MVRHAFRVLTDDEIETRLVAFSDDMDGLRKTPENIPNRETGEANLGKPLTEVPDPFGEYDSFAAHNNARLRRFLDSFGFDYEFAPRPTITSPAASTRRCCTCSSASSGPEDHAAVAARGARGDLFAVPADPPGHPRRHAGPADRHRRRKGVIRWRDPATGEEFETPVTGGHCKLQWKPDWAMRWYALGVDYEMAGKDLINSVKLSSQIVRALGGDRPKASTTSCSSTKRARRSPSRRATA